MRFIGEEVTVELPDRPYLEKKPPAPVAFTWGKTRFVVAKMLAEWHRYGQADRQSGSGRPPYSVRSGRRQGSWGVGRAYFRLRAGCGRIFDLYYDRAPKGQRRTGTWVLWRELSEEEIEVGLEE